MDIRRYIPKNLDLTELDRLGGFYEGIISEVREEPVRNRYKGTRSIEPVIVFEDGTRVVMNIGMRRVMAEFFGDDTDEWIGRRINVVAVRRPTRDPDSGDETIRRMKVITRDCRS